MILCVRWLLLCLLLLNGFCLSAQQNSRAQKLYDNALRYQIKHQPEKAEASMQSAIRADPGFTDAYIALGNWYMDRHQYQQATDIFIKGEQACANGQKIFSKSIAKSLIYSGDIARALPRIPSAPTDPEWKKLQVQARFRQQALNNKKVQLPEPVGTPWRINTGDPEMFPAISADGTTFFFTRRINGMDEDLYYARRDSCGGWLAARNLGVPPNSPDLESAQSISADGHYLFMMRCENRTVNGWDLGGCDLYMAYTVDSLWSIPLSFGATINTPDYEGMPSLSGDNRELFFVSNRPGGYGGLDIWSSRFEHGLWQVPRNLGPEINTGSDESSPFIYADNSTLYFASRGHEGMGGYDLFMSRRIDDSTWSKPVNLGWPVNSPADDISLSLDANADTAYFATDRDGQAGNFDIYKIGLEAAQQPIAVTFFKGYVYDSIERSRLNYVNIYFTDSSTGKELYHVVSNRGDASYEIALPVGNTYYLTLSRMAYKQMEDTIRSVVAEDRKPIFHNFSMLPYGYEAPVTDSLLLRVAFKRNVLSVSDTDKLEISRMLEPWRAQKNITILVNGYTDNSGTPLLNEQFSSTRARMIGDYIATLGFPQEMIQVQGWGEANTLADNTSEENMDKNRRVEIVIRK